MNDSVAHVDDLRRACTDFRDARDWKQFHNPKEVALCLSIEAAEILELFRFKSEDAVALDMKDETRRDLLSQEMADVLYWLLMLSDHTGIDLASALERKLRINEQKYPVRLARGRNLKYTELAAEEASLG